MFLFFNISFEELKKYKLYDLLIIETSIPDFRL